MAAASAGTGAKERPGVPQDPARRRVVAGVALFVLGFTAVFVAFMAAAGAIGSYLVQWEGTIMRVLGVVVILMGLAFLGAVPFLQRERRMHLSPRAGLWGAPLLGVVFGLGWTPCIGPTLSAVQALALHEGTAARGALLSVAYSLGLGIPFLVAGFAFRRMLGAVAWVRRHQLWVTRLGGMMLIMVGLLLVTGLWDQWVGDLRSWVGGFEVAV
jgi:cytochrome c-type biogenesis protein